MAGFESRLRRELESAAAAGVRRGLRAVVESGRTVQGERMALLNLAGNDYLGLAGHPRLKAAATAATERQGVGAGASRLIVGHLAEHAEAERQFARFKHAEAALLFPTGFMANLAVLTALARHEDLILLDKLNHASLIDSARASSAKVRIFPHRNYDKLERLLQRFDKHKPKQGNERDEAQALIVTDSVFSMDGDCADLIRLSQLATQYEAVLIVDEAHGSGVLGRRGAGLAEHLGVSDRIDVTVSTASKALGGLGGIVTGSRLIIDSLIQGARPFIYTTGVPPAQAAAISAALAVIQDEPWRRDRLAELSLRMVEGLGRRGWRCPQLSNGQSQGQTKSAEVGLADHAEHGGGECDWAPINRQPVTPIVPIIVGESQAALTLSSRLQTRGILAPAIRPPTVSRGQSRLRLSLRADLTDADVDYVLRALDEAQWQTAYGVYS